MPTELGVRSVVSTWALLHGLAQHVATASPDLPLRLTCMDIDPVPTIAHVAHLAAACDVSLSFVQGNRCVDVCTTHARGCFVSTCHVICSEDDEPVTMVCVP